MQHSFGFSSEKLIKYLINAAMCSLQSGDKITAQMYLNRIKSILSINGYDIDSGTYNHAHAVLYLREKLFPKNVEGDMISDDGDGEDFDYADFCLVSFKHVAWFLNVFRKRESPR